jgi:hypothetical protein
MLTSYSVEYESLGKKSRKNEQETDVETKLQIQKIFKVKSNPSVPSLVSSSSYTSTMLTSYSVKYESLRKKSRKKEQETDVETNSKSKRLTK